MPVGPHPYHAPCSEHEKEQPNHHWLSVHLKISWYFTLLLTVNPELNSKAFKFCHKILVHPVKRFFLVNGDKTSSFIQWARGVQNIPQPSHVITNWPARHTVSLVNTEDLTHDVSVRHVLLQHRGICPLDKLSPIASRRSSPSTDQKDF